MIDLNEVSVIGALGKMGRGISTLVLLEQAWRRVLNKQETLIHLIDLNTKEASQVKSYFRDQLRKSAEKRIIELRAALQDTDLVSNEEMIDYFIESSLDGINISSEWSSAKNSTIIFEAVAESLPIKLELYRFLKKDRKVAQKYYTNTSSLPIQMLNDGAELEGNIMGFHFYNPPMVQKLMEIIPLTKCDPTWLKESEELAKLLNKKSVISRDVAGFIGNGYLFREIKLAIDWLEKFSKHSSQEKAMVLIDQLTKEWLIRPMGIFQLIDYIGLDVCQNIAKVMSEYTQDKYPFNWFEKWPKRGGQHPDGSQREGLFRYGKQGPSEIYSLTEDKYIPLPKIDLGEAPFDLSWKSCQKEKDPLAVLRDYFEKLAASDSQGAQISQKWLEQGLKYMHELVDQNVAHSLNDVSEVIKLGFFHLYTPDEVIDVISTLS